MKAHEAGTLTQNPTAICTAGLNFFDLADAARQRVSIDDIATSLSQQCRFTGHTRRFYSVSEHSVRVSYECPNFPLAGLLHDAHEAYLGDISRPLKMFLNDQATPFDDNGKTFGELLKKLARNINISVGRQFGIDPESMENEEVTAADNRLLATEKRDVMGVPDQIEWPGLPAPLTQVIAVPWSPRTARREFLRRFYELFGKGSR